MQLKKQFTTVSKFLKKNYQIDVVEDILLSNNQRSLLYGDVTNPNHIELHLVVGSLNKIGLKNVTQITLNELFSYLDFNNKYAEVSGKKEYQQYVETFLFNTEKDTSVTFPVIINQNRMWMRINQFPVKNNINAYYIENVSFFHNQEELLYEKTHRDSLTQLFNRYTLDYHYGLRYKKPLFHALYLDLDNFKILNDTYGHLAGNVALKMFSDLLKSYSNEYNQFYRIGGDEFVGLFFEEEDEIKKIAQEIIEKTRLLRVENTETYLTVSMGIIKATKADDVIRKADKVLYNVKRSGKNKYLYEVES